LPLLRLNFIGSFNGSGKIKKVLEKNRILTEYVLLFQLSYFGMVCVSLLGQAESRYQMTLALSDADLGVFYLLFQ
jgi:hypothetical protein